MEPLYWVRDISYRILLHGYPLQGPAKQVLRYAQYCSGESRGGLKGTGNTYVELAEDQGISVTRSTNALVC